MSIGPVRPMPLKLLTLGESRLLFEQQPGSIRRQGSLLQPSLRRCPIELQPSPRDILNLLVAAGLVGNRADPLGRQVGTPLDHSLDVNPFDLFYSGTGEKTSWERRF